MTLATKQDMVKELIVNSGPEIYVYPDDLPHKASMGGCLLWAQNGNSITVGYHGHTGLSQKQIAAMCNVLRRSLNGG